jgi:hypothetical protein
METRHLPQTCKWGEQTLQQPMPLWLQAWTYAWTCVSGSAPRVLEVSDECAQCPRWEERPAEPAERSVTAGR